MIHGDSDVPLMKRIYKLMEPLLAEDEADPALVAGLWDRIAINEGREQRWGMFYDLVDGREVPYPTEDPDQLEVRRATMGLGDRRFRRN
jgi:hypothetical protein